MAIKPIEILIKARDEASAVFGGLRGKVAALGAALAGALSLAAFMGAVRGAAQLEAKLSEVRSVSGATADEMVALRQAAEDAGATTKFSATEGADALGNLARAGLTAQQAITALPSTLQLAQAGGLGLAESAEIVTRTLAGFNLAADQSARIADVLAQGANASNTSVQGLAQALSYAAPTAVSLGLSLETTVAIIGKFADAGIDASRAGTALNAILAQFSDPASKFRQELAGAGIITGNFEQALRELAAAGPAGQKAILAVGTEAGPALRALLNQGIGALDGLRDKLLQAQGSAAATAATMEDNLPGAMSSLASAWDTVKNTLATPVLPVLKDGVVQLANAFRGAVADGTIGKFGTAIATAFQTGLKWAQEFLGKIDFDALSQRMQAWADRAGEAFDTVGRYATNAGNTVSLVYGVMSSGVNTVMAVIYKLGEGFSVVSSRIQSGLALLLEGISKITFGGVSASFKQAAEEMRLSAGATWAVSEAFAQKAGEAFDAATQGAEVARAGWAGLTASTQEAATQAAASQQVMQNVATTLTEVGSNAQAMGQQAQAAAAQQQQAAVAARQAVAELKTEYEAALAAGNVQLALEKLQTMRGALEQTATTAKASAQDIENAYTRLGITSTAELAKQRDAALRDFEIIRSSGTASAQDVQNAFRVYAERSIAANGGVVTEVLKLEAALHGVSLAGGEAGRSIVGGMNAAADSTRAAAAELKRLQALSSQSGPAGGTRYYDDHGNLLEADGTPVTEKGVSGGSPRGSVAYSPSLYNQVQQKVRAGTLDASDMDLVKRALEEQQRLVDWANTFVAGGATGPRGGGTQNLDTIRKLYEAMRGGASAGGSGQTVNINLNGATTSIAVGGPQDAAALEQVLRQLASFSNRAMI